MTNYLIMIHLDGQNEADARTGEVSAEYREFMRRHAGALRGGASLHSPETGTTVRADGRGSFAVTDGPFAESKEILGGFFIVEAADLDEALAIAKDIPQPNVGVEVRPIRAQS